AIASPSSILGATWPTGVPKKCAATLPSSRRTWGRSNRVLQVTGLSAGYGNIQVLKEVGLHVKEGQIVALIGANGAGKTTTLRAICGQITPWAGRVLFQGEPVEGLPSYQLARRGLVHVPEGRAILTRMTVRENLEMGAFSRRDREVAAD